ncbi:MAG: gliding motility protein GldL [Bacteroidetes bacterium]|nr:gliding motility protein GldL [Bacteroidota bacterium]
MKPGSKAWKKFMAKLYGIGAAVVIIGAMFKIQHWPFASFLLVVGLSTEAVIFFFSAFEPIHEEPDWSLVYPELALPEDAKKNLRNSKGGVSAQLDGMLEEAKIDSDLIASLGEGMRTFSSNAKQMADVTSAASASTSYADNLKDASDKVSKLASTYEAASASLTGLTSHADQGSSAGAHLQKMTENLSTLNSMYEIQIEEMSKTKAMYADMGALVQNLADSVEDTKLYKENISELSKNLKSLNTIYANMLNAMGSARQ